jgi:hypothetical protein
MPEALHRAQPTHPNCQHANIGFRNLTMSHEVVPPPGESAPGMEYPSALAALYDRQIFAIIPIEGGFEVREQGRDEYFVRLLPEQLRELGEEIIALADSGLAAVSPAAEVIREPEPQPEPAAAEPAPPPTEGHTISIPSGIWDARVTQEFQARIARLESADAPEKSTPPKQIKPWIKP